MRKLSLIMLLLVISVSYAIPIEPVIFVNKSTVDYENAKILMDSLYSSREINIDEDVINIIAKDITYIPAVDKLEISNDNEKVEIKFDRDGNKIKYKDVSYYLLSKFEKGNKVEWLGKEYVVEDIDEDYVILRDLTGKEVTTNASFEYENYKGVITLVSGDLDTVYMDIYKNGKLIKSVRLNKGKFYQLENENLGIIYKNYTKEWKNRIYFTFDIYHSIKLEKGKEFSFDKRFVVEDIDNDKIEFRYKNADKTGNTLELFNFTITPEKFCNGYVIFKVIKKRSKTMNMKDKDVGYLDDGIYAIKTNDTIHIYYKGRELKNHDKIYFASIGLLDTASLNISNDIILIGGPKVNRFVRELEDKGLLKVKITNDSPGSHRGVIQKIKNPYNNGYIYILAGSDRWGTKAAITAFLTRYDDEDVLMVEWDNGNVRVIS